MGWGGEKGDELPFCHAAPAAPSVKKVLRNLISSGLQVFVLESSIAFLNWIRFQAFQNKTRLVKTLSGLLFVM